jgi:hypothetical protein
MNTQMVMVGNQNPRLKTLYGNDMGFIVEAAAITTGAVSLFNSLFSSSSKKKEAKAAEEVAKYNYLTAMSQQKNYLYIAAGLGASAVLVAFIVSKKSRRGKQNEL